MRSTIFSILLFVFGVANSQPNWSKDGTGFNSCFQKLVEGNFTGTANGMLQLLTTDGERIAISFSKDSASLEIIPDKNEIYDVSFKNYSTKNSDIKVLYRTYAYANEIILLKGSQEYQLSLIDGGCDLVIDGLDYQYITTDEKELLMITFSKDIGLFTSKNYDLAPDLIIAKNSNMVFAINRSNHQ